MTAPTSEGAAAALAAHGFAGSLLELPSEPLPERAWERLVATAIRQHLTPQLAAAVRGGALPATADQVRAGLDAHAGQLATVLQVERCLLAVAEVFERAAVDYRVLDGAAAAHTIYARPALRAFGSVDVLVRSGHFERAASVLSELGCHRLMPPLRDGFDHRFGWGVAFTDPGGCRVALHRTLAEGFFGLSVHPEPLFERALSYVLAGRSLPALAREETFLRACYQAATVRPTPLMGLRDIAELLLRSAFDEERVLALARSWDGQAAVACAVERAWTTLRLADAVPLSAWAARYRPTAREQRALAACASGPGQVARLLADLRALPRLRDGIAYVHALLLPDREFLRHLRLGRLQWLRHGSAATGRGGSPP